MVDVTDSVRAGITDSVRAGTLGGMVGSVWRSRHCLIPVLTAACAQHPTYCLFLGVGAGARPVCVRVREQWVQA
jgi:hypothetical protein